MGGGAREGGREELEKEGKKFPTHFPVQEVESNQQSGALESSCGHHAQSQRPTARHHHCVTELDGAQLHCMDGAGQGLNEGCLPCWNGLRDLHSVYNIIST